MSNQLNIPQFSGTTQVNRRLNPVAGDVLGFNPTTSALEARVPAIVSKQASFVEDAASITHAATFALPVGATLLDIIVDAGVLWTDAQAVLKVGDTADDDGYFTGVNLAATDLLVGEQLRISESSLWGGKEGVYLVAATGRRGPVSANFGGKYVAGSNIVATISVTTPSGTAGRTFVTVLYTMGQAVTPILL